MSDELDEATAREVSRALADEPSPRMPEDVWDRLQAALVIEAANRDAADGRCDRPRDPVRERLAKAWDPTEDTTPVD